MKRTPLQRKTRLTAKHSNGKPRTPLKKVNVERQAKRKARMRRWYASPEWKRQRAESLALAGNRCQFVSYVREDGGRLTPVRCTETTRLQVHEFHYRFERSIPSARVVYCKAHHEFVEVTCHPTRRHGR